MAKDTGKADTRRPRRLIEVAFPLAQVSKEAAREKSIRHGHISTLHIWWARRSLVACRAVTFATLVPDPDDPDCPPEFQQAVERVVGRRAEPDASGQPREDNLRNRLVDFVARISTWEASNDPVMDGARKLSLPFGSGRQQRGDPLPHRHPGRDPPQAALTVPHGASPATRRPPAPAGAPSTRGSPGPGPPRTPAA